MRRIFYALLLCVLCVPSFAFGWTGKVVGVVDGDTIDVLRYGVSVRVRLYGIDCPQKYQDLGERTKKYTAEQVFGGEVNVNTVADTDRYGRVVGIVYPNGSSKSLNEMLIQEGLAWVFTRYCTSSECSRWSGMEAMARKFGLGLWSVKNPVPPWEFRRK